MSAPTSITNSPCHSTYEWRKRTRSNDDDGKNAKKSRWYYILASESSSMSDDGTESIHSVQGKETDYAKDTSDTDTKSEMSDYDIQVEYDVISSSEEENIYSEGSSSGDDDALLAAGAVAASLCEERSLDVWATDGDDDTDSAMSDFDSQLQDNQKCRMCKTRPTVSCFPLCSHCHQVRKTYFPPRPRKHKHKKTDEDSPSSSQVTTDKLRSCLTGLSSQESGICSSQELKPLEWDKVIVPDSLISKAKDVPSLLPSEKSGSNEPISGSSSSSLGNMLSSFDDSWSNWALATKEMCIMCNERPKNGIFLHNTGGHMCCCYRCAVKYWNKSKRCAYCNRKVKNVVKAFIV